jgi:hypothetical protein
MEMLIEYIKPELLVLIPVLYLVGVAIKSSAIADKHIPWILGVVSIVMSALWIFATTEMGGTSDVALAVFTAVTQGVLIAGASVYANQLVKQAGKDDK